MSLNSTYAQDAASAPIAAAFVDMRIVCPECPAPPPDLPGEPE
jgi:hypothetical protein